MSFASDATLGFPPQPTAPSFRPGSSLAQADAGNSHPARWVPSVPAVQEQLRLLPRFDSAQLHPAWFGDWQSLHSPPRPHL
ncbi:hypothetical protein H4R33_003367 [Dimargaris cristalligena]|nr:hypothetical protein H4R33_003367 [Dimargaris cristalligena]